MTNEIDIIGIDEIQFFDEAIIPVLTQLVFVMKKNVIAAGLNRDYRGRPFGCMPLIMSMAHFITTLHAFCAVCGAPAVHSKRIKGSKDLVQTGAKDSYEARCTMHFSPQLEDSPE
ncbi:MAG: Thymidine kinase [Candidatus Uhrbacteria bacterium GW2011_GWF2_40_263]|nr:MAG: Thymidine kinase [Candidatus Uhrbacteria bacterium GW2011_GWF2_40_263]